MSILQTGPDGYAIPAADLLADQLTECEALDVLAGPPESWPQCPWVDDDRYELGPALTPEEGFYEPTEADIAFLLDLEERAEYERGCNARFAP